MFPWNAAFVMVLLALAMANVPKKEWFSSSIVVFGLSFVAMAYQPEIEGILRGRDVGRGADILVIWFFLFTAIAAKRIYDDLRNPPFPRRRVIHD